jgi:hypothetical protein
MEFEFEEKPENGDKKMDQESKSGYLVDTTDCLEAISVIRCWKNFLFIIIIVCLLLLQGLFWVVNFNDVENDQPWAMAAAKAQHLPQAGEPAFSEVSPTGGPAAVKIPEKIKQAAKQAAQEANAPAPPEQQPEQGVVESPQGGSRFSIAPKMEHVVAVVRFLNFILVPASVIYCLTMLFAFKVSLIGRLGGINHIARAFFLSLLFVVLFLPWQLLFSPVFAGAMWTPTELIAACQMPKTPIAQVSFYLRFTGYWILVLLLVVFSQIRSMRWARATLKRLEVV